MNSYRYCRRPGRRFTTSTAGRPQGGRGAGAIRVAGTSRAGRANGRQGGFSLIELVVVATLILAIVAFAGSRMFGSGDRARANLAQAQVQTMAEMVESYEMDTGRLPSSLDDLVVQPAGVSGWLGPYTREADLNDPWGTPLEYRVPGEGRRFDVISYGADRSPGGEGTNADIRLR